MCRPGEPGGRAGALRNPDGVATDGAGNLYVADVNFRVSQFTTSGTFVRAWGFGVRPGGGQGFEICTRATGCRVGIAGDGAGQLSLMLGLGSDAAGNVYVADSDNSRVSEFTGAGAFTRAFGLAVVPGDGKEFEVCTSATGCRRGRRDDRVGGFISTSAVAAEPGGAIYVADGVLSRLQCFGEPGGTPCVRNLFRFGELKRDRRRGTASLAVKVPGPGNLRVRGKLIRTATKRTETAGSVSLPIRPRCRAKRALNRDGEVRVRIHVSYRPRSGGPNTKVRRVELRKRR